MTYSDRPWCHCYDEHVPHTLTPYPDWTVPDLLRIAATENPNTPAIVMPSRLPLVGQVSKTTTYQILYQQANALSNALLSDEFGLEKGDRVAILMPNSTAFIVSWFGILGAGMVAVGINPTYPPDRIAEMLQDAGAKVIITLSLFYEVVQKARAKTPLTKIMVSFIKDDFQPVAKFLFGLAREKKEGHAADIAAGDVNLSDLVRRYPTTPPAIEVKNTDYAIFQYTGGTTGPSKAAVSTHAAIVANTLQQNAWLTGTGEKEVGQRMLAAIPFYHVFGMISVIASSVTARATMIIVINARDIPALLDVINTYKPRIFHGVPALYNAINVSEDVQTGKVDISSIEYCLSGSAPLPRPTKDQFETLTGGKLIEGYGMSEAPTATHCNPLNGENRPGSIGLPLPDVDCRIVDPDDPFHVLEVGAIGEIAIHGPQLMSHYHERPTESDNTLVTDAEGRRWLLTGDLGRMSEDGYFYIVDRKKDMALIGGFNVYPNQVDQVLNAHPAVAEVAVGVIPHPEKVGQEALKAWVVTKEGMSVTPEELMEFAAQKLARYEIPSRFEFIDSLPRTAVGKILRRQLIQQEIARQEQDI